MNKDQSVHHHQLNYVHNRTNNNSNKGNISGRRGQATTSAVIMRSLYSPHMTAKSVSFCLTLCKGYKASMLTFYPPSIPNLSYSDGSHICISNFPPIPTAGNDTMSCSLKFAKILVQSHFPGNQPHINMVKLTVNCGASTFAFLWIIRLSWVLRQGNNQPLSLLFKRAPTPSQMAHK